MSILIVYVDDIVVTGNNDREIAQLKKFLATEFEIKDLGELKYFLGVEVARSKDGFFVSQRKYVLDLLRDTGKTGCRPADTPYDPNTKLSSDEGELVDDVGQYQKIVGKLLYLSLTRPDITFVVSVLSQFMHAPRVPHMQAVDRVLRYLKSCPGKGLLFSKHGHMKIEAYTDADWAGSIDDRRSTSGYCVFVGGNLVTWRSKKQPVVARSSAEAEFRSMAHGVSEVIWMQRLLTELQVPFESPMRLYCDNQAAISIANNPVQHDRTKHVEVDRHFIRERVLSKELCLPFVPTDRQCADIFTKGLFKPQFELLMSKLGMCDVYA